MYSGQRVIYCLPRRRSPGGTKCVEVALFLYVGPHVACALFLLFLSRSKLIFDIALNSFKRLL